MCILYSVLNGSAKRWWFFAKLRREGHPDEARILERKSIRDDIRILRAVLDSDGFLNVGDGGWSLHYVGKDGNEASLRGYDVDRDGEPQAAMLLGVLTIDHRPIPSSRYGDVMRLPIPNVNGAKVEPEKGWHGLVKVNPKVYADMVEGFGAIVLNR